MKCLILAAGYATRLYPLTENFPKPLLKVGDKTILDWLIDDIDSSGLVDEYIVISNHKFAEIFKEWARASVTVLDDGTSTNETRLGAVRDIQFAIEQLGLDDDLLVIAGDNLLDFSLVRFIEYAREKGTTCIMRYYEPSEEKLHKTGVATVDENDLILSMEEKPTHPKSHWCCPPFYFYHRSDVPLVKVGIDSGCGVDAPGSFIAWLSTQTPVHAWEMPGRRYDIGNLESYEEVKARYRGIDVYTKDNKMVLNQELLDTLSEKAKASPRLRMNLDLRNSSEDGSQRMLNALEPGTQLPIHRHMKSSETVVCLRGHLREIFYDEDGSVTEVIDLVPGGPVVGLNIPIGQWHTVEVLESGTVILECKDGGYEPLGEEDIMRK